MLRDVSNPAKLEATYEDVLKSPPHVVVEVVFGVLYQSPRPALPHAVAASAGGMELGPPFFRGRGGPGGWIILGKPEIHLGKDIVVPDLASWRRETLPRLPEDAFSTVAPDWICEVASPSTRALDRGKKLDVRVGGALGALSASSARGDGTPSRDTYRIRHYCDTIPRGAA